MILLEFSPPFQWRPSLKRQKQMWRFMWGWIAIARWKGDLNHMVLSLLNEGIKSQKEDTWLMRDLS